MFFIQRLSKNVGNLFPSIDWINFDSSIVDVLAKMMIFQSYILCLRRKLGTFGNFETASIILPDSAIKIGLGILKGEYLMNFFHQI